MLLVTFKSWGWRPPPGHASGRGRVQCRPLSQGSSQLLAMPSCRWNLDMSSFSFSAVLTLWKTVPHCLSLEGYWGGGRGVAWGIWGCGASLFPWKVWTLGLPVCGASVLGRGQGAQLVGLCSGILSDTPSGAPSQCQGFLLWGCALVRAELASDLGGLILSRCPFCCAKGSAAWAATAQCGEAGAPGAGFEVFLGNIQSSFQLPGDPMHW